MPVSPAVETVNMSSSAIVSSAILFSTCITSIPESGGIKDEPSAVAGLLIHNVSTPSPPSITS